MTSLSLDIVLVNWNSGVFLGRCIASIREARGDSFSLGRVVVIDNASSDGSADGQEADGSHLQMIRNGENRGFAAACNQGAQGSGADYLLFLNPDVELFENSLRVPVEFLEAPENRQVGICGVQLVSGDGQVSRSCSRFPRLGNYLCQISGLERLSPARFPGPRMAEWDHRTSQRVDQVMGAFFLVRRSLFESLGGFDERFFVYFEDVDFALRALRQGWESYYLATAQAQHSGAGCTSQAKALRLFYSLRSRTLYARKHFSWAAATALLLCTVVLEPFSRLVLAIGRGSGQDVSDMIRGYALFWRTLPGFLKGAREARTP
jgi:N-acetylglucosaminyl-diphospho-decaprenol L-rhamnosyltransferase